MQAAIEQLRAGGVVAVPTESYFALAVDATSGCALDALFTLKPRDTNKGIGLVVPRTNDWRRWVRESPGMTETFVRRFWPGPLTLVLPAAEELDPRLVVQGHVAIRMPGPSAVLELVNAWGRPLTATSANLTGCAPCISSEAVVEQFGPHIGPRLLVLAGRALGGEVSSLVRVNPQGWELLREGAIKRRDLDAVRACEKEDPSATRQ